MSNEVLNVIKKRRSIRTYKADAIPEEILNAVLEAGTFAPTGGGKQSPIIVAITLPQENMMLAAASLGLGLVCVHRERGILTISKARRFLRNGGVSEFLRGVGAIALGYPASSDVKAAERKENYIVRI